MLSPRRDWANDFLNGWPLPIVGKGRIEVGYDADLVLVDLQKSATIRNAEQETKCGWSPFEGVTFPGSVEAVFVDGRILRFQGKDA